MKLQETRQIIISCLDEVKLLEANQKSEILQDQEADVELASLSIDSLKIVDLCMALETALGREVEVEVLIENSSINKLARYYAAED